MQIAAARTSFTGPRGNTVHTARVGFQGPNRTSSVRVRAVDLGSNGSIDAAFGRRTVNGELRSIWGEYGNNPLGEMETFEARIWGDPHFSLDGSVHAEEVSARFDNHDLGERTQIAGVDFALETNVVPWGAGNGTAVVGSATVSTGLDRNKKDVTFDADGNLTIGGEAVSLENGGSMHLNRTSELTREDDGSSTVSSRNGKVTNNLSSHEHHLGNYINIESSVNDVQTVGWLQNQV